MAKRVSHRDSSCGVARPLDAIGDWWSLLIVRDAFDGLRRFGEFQKSLGLAKNILSARLRNLVAHGIMDMVAASDSRSRPAWARKAAPEGSLMTNRSKTTAARYHKGLRRWGYMRVSVD